MLLKYLVIEDMKYSVVLGRDMINCQVAGIDNIRNMILFRKGVTEEVESDLNRAADSFLTRDTMLEPNSVTQLDFETRLDSEEGEIMGTKDLEKNGVKVWSHNICENEKHCWVHNTSNEPVLLKKEVVVARMREDTDIGSVDRVRAR